MSRKAQLRLVLFIIIIALIGGLWALTAYYDDLPNRLSQHETLVLGQNRFVPGSQAALRVVVRDSSNGAPLPAAHLNVMLAPASGGEGETVFTGATNELGTADVTFTVPESAQSSYNLVVETESDLGQDTLTQPVTVDRDYRILLTTDKPLYQPGQLIHLRALALSTFDRTPAAGQTLELTIADGKGNTVFRDTLTTSDFGVAATDFQLASEVNTGPYKISAQMGDTTSEKTVTVEHYVLPQFDVTLSTEESYYLPGELVRGSLNAVYFFGKEVAGGTVQVTGFTFDFERNDVFSLEGTTDESGNFTFEFELPDYIAGSDLEGGRGTFYLQAAVTDLTNHTENSTLSFPVAQNSLVIEAVPEGGQLRPGVENILYVLTSYPDGTPAETAFDLSFSDGNPAITAATGQYGLAEVRFVPATPWQELTIAARDAKGNTAVSNFSLDGQQFPETVLLRPERPLYRVGDTMNLTILSSEAAGTVYLDIVREGQTVSTRAVSLQNGEAQVAVDLAPDLFGTLELHAYKILPTGAIVRDTRLVLVDEAGELALAFNADQEVYRPGDTAALDVQVSDGNDGRVAAAVGLAIVDESVFALAEQDPGFAKLYFMLEQELLQPKYDLHGFSVPDLITTEPVDDPILRTAQEGAAQASLAAASPDHGRFTLQANSHEEALNRAYERQDQYFNRLSMGFYGLLLLVPLAAAGVSGVAFWREKRFWRSLGIALGMIVLLVLVIGAGKLGRFVEPLFYGDSSVAVVGLVALVCFAGLAVHAWRQRNRGLGWTVGLLPVAVALLVVTAYAASKANIYPDDTVIGVLLLAMLLLPLVLFMWTANLGSKKQWLAALAATVLALFFTLVPLLVMAGMTTFSGGRARGEALMPVPAMANAVDDGQFVVEEAEMAVEEEAMAEAEAPAAGESEPPRLRQYFPETMYWLPQGETDANGRLSLEIPVADSITTWRLTALASTQDGRLGSATGSLRVFQDFFIDLDLPLALTVGDEVAIPVGVFNYLPESQDVRLELEMADWFELLDEAEKEITIASNDITVVYFRIRVSDFGRHPFTVTAWGSQMSDAIRKEVRVFPDGKEIRTTHSDRLEPGTPLTQVVNVPTDAIPGTQALTVKIYPGVVSQVVEGLDSILRMPNGCFEQTSSSTYPNVLVLDYLQTSGQVSPEVQFKAEDYINIGYQRLTTFEVDGGGFSLFGQPPSDRMLTAYGLQEFSDMSRVHSVDPAMIERAARWLLSQQNSDGSWDNDQGLVHESTWSNLENDKLPVTAYIVWSLVEAGFVDDAGTQKGLSYVREFHSQASDPYVLALVANALVAADLETPGDLQPATDAVLDRLAGMAQSRGNGVVWPSDIATFMGSEGQTGSIETTALATLALLRAQYHPEVTSAALTALIQQKDSFGTWHNTQATILALKALIQTVRSGSENVDATVTVSLNNGQTRTVQVTPDNFDVVQLITFDDVRLGENSISINVEGEGNLMYQVTGSYYLPWEKLAQYPEVIEPQELVTIDVAYDRTELAVDDTVNVDVTVSLNEPGSRSEWALIDLGVPPGFSVNTEDLVALVEASRQQPEETDLPTIERYELTGRQILVYIGNLSHGNPLTFSYRLTAKFPLRAQTPASNAYDYYNPDVAGETPPQTLVVAQP